MHSVPGQFDTICSVLRWMYLVQKKYDVKDFIRFCWKKGVLPDNRTVAQCGLTDDADLYAIKEGQDT